MLLIYKKVQVGGELTNKRKLVKQIAREAKSKAYDEVYKLE